MLNNTVRNNGLLAGAFNVGLYLASSATVTTGDRQLTTRRVTAAWRRTPSRPDATSVQIPSDVTPGQLLPGRHRRHRLRSAAEGNENNNAASTPIVIAKPDLVVTVLTAPATAGAGLSITVNSTVKNQATAAVTAAASTLAFYLSTDATFDAGDVRLTATRAIATLAKDAISAGATTLTIPAGTAAGIVLPDRGGRRSERGRRVQRSQQHPHRADRDQPAGSQRDLGHRDAHADRGGDERQHHPDGPERGAEPRERSGARARA